MKLSEILTENAAIGSISGSAIAGMRGCLFSGPVKRDRLPNPRKIKKIKYSNRNNWNTKD